MTNYDIDIDYSVLMSVYKNDQPEYLSAAIESMEQQSVPFHDMVIVCDGPISKALDDVLNNWRAKLGERLVIAHLPENIGLGGALNAGLSLCDCDIVARMDADDLSRPDRCEILLAAMAVRGLDLVGGAIEEFDLTPGDLGIVRRLPNDMDSIRTYAARRNPFNHMTVMFLRCKVEDVGGYQPYYLMEDYWLWARMICAGCQCGNVSNVVVDARVGSGMYKRRSGLKYLNSQFRFFNGLREMGLSGIGDMAITLGARTISSIMPEAVIKETYQRLLRG